MKFKHEDLEHRKIKEIEDELDLINDLFRQDGFVWALKKRELFAVAETVDPPKESFDLADEIEIKRGLELEHEEEDWYVLREDKLDQEVVVFSDESDDDESSVDYTPKKRKEIRELWYLSVEKNF